MRSLAARLIAAVVGVCSFPTLASALDVTSSHDLYRITLSPASGRAPLRQLHSWTIRLESQSQVFMPTELSIDGGMPGHGHGLPSVPEITRLLPTGDLLVEGMLFNMSGRWQLRLGIGGPTGFDTAIVDFQLSADGVVSPLQATLAQADAPRASITMALMRTLSLDALGPVPTDPSNHVAGDPRAVELGRSIFFDPRFSGSGKLSCASCHVPEKAFTDGLAQARGAGQTSRNTPDLIGAAWRPWLYWDGRRDSLWAQALIPFEAPAEMAGSRVRTVRTVAEDADYRIRYEALFGSIQTPDVSDAGPLGTPQQIDTWNAVASDRRRDINRAFSNIGKAIAAFERRIVPVPGRFDAHVAALERGERGTLSEVEINGLSLFLDESRTNCLRCHNGPLLTNQGFHNIGTGSFEGAHLDFGRVFGLQAVVMDEFNCMGPYSDAPAEVCAQLTFVPQQEVPEEYAGAFKVPGLRNLTVTAPYMHDGRYATLEEVVEHYRHPPPAAIAAGEIQPVEITDAEAASLVAFLKTLDGGYRILSD